MAKKMVNTTTILVVLLLLFIGLIMYNKNTTEGYAVVAGGAPVTRARTRARVDANTYTGPGDAVRGPVAPARRRAGRRAVVWYNPYTWF
jgi:hypothetical protein